MGLAALVSACGLAEKEITSGSVAFLLAPRMNAAGRLGHVEKAVELLLCEEEEKAAALAVLLAAAVAMFPAFAEVDITPTSDFYVYDGADAFRNQQKVIL